MAADPNITIDYGTTPRYIAPQNVYTTARSMGSNAQVNYNYNLTWMFGVDSGFSFLVRLHFCEFTDNITKVNQRVFDVFLNNRTAEQGVDVILLVNEQVYVPLYRDYVVMVPGGNLQQDLWLALHPDPNSKPQYHDAILNGVEIFKTSDPKSNLAGPNLTPSPKHNVVGSSLALSSRQALAIGLCVVAAASRHHMHNGAKYTSASSHTTGSAKTNTTGSYASSLPSNLCRHFSFVEIKTATNNFDDSLVLGVGGFGKVYKGEIDGGTTKVAIKRGNPLSEQGVHEFQTEIEMLSKLRLRHLVSLIRYCEENCEMIFVYDYMAHRTLREHLYITKKPPLPWK
ncbi:receptor-like protein kinase FERONIA [Hibiscus syriacus]|uniref:receptor-like protein kinase FERONIA n=1 Tax=Hibiscus syriacus TaxID=106335 RepID=UPI0019239AB8|nr:receptor-like protein kinase FERONIA [Hibiscus syriacus]